MAHEGHGNHWEAVFEDLDQLRGWLPVMVERGRLIDQRPQRPLAPDETVGIVWPDAPLGSLSLIVGEDPGNEARNIFASSYPFAAQGTRHELVVEEIVPWGNGIEAWIKAQMPNEGWPVLTFFDTRFYANRDRLRTGLRADFILAGVAYFAEVSHPEPALITKPETIRAMRAGTDRADDLSPIEVRMEGGAMLFPRDEYAPDEYEFHGPVRAIETFDLFGTSISKIKVTIARQLESDDRDIDVDLYVGKHVWRSNERPLPGADIQGVLWLQGHLAEQF